MEFLVLCESWEELELVLISERSMQLCLKELASTLTRLETPACIFRGQHDLILILIRGSIGLKNVGIVQKRADWREIPVSAAVFLSFN